MWNADSIFEDIFHNIDKNTLSVIVQSVLVACVVQWCVVVQCGVVQWLCVVVDLVDFDLVVFRVDLSLIQYAAVFVVL